MQEHNFILTDMMKTGNHRRLEKFIEFSNIEGQTFDAIGHFYWLHQYDLKKYDRKIAMIDYREDNSILWNNEHYWQDLLQRIEYLHQLGFVFIIANPWESHPNIAELEFYSNIKEKIYKLSTNKKFYYWCGEASWFWWMM